MTTVVVRVKGAGSSGCRGTVLTIFSQNLMLKSERPDAVCKAEDSLSLYTYLQYVPAST